MTVSGWGLLNDGGNAAKKLQEVDLEVKNTWSNLMQIMWYHHAQIIWMKECREDFHYKKNWITSKMMCTFKWVSPQTLPYLHSLEKKKFFCAQAKLWCLSRRQWRPLGEGQPHKWKIWTGSIGPSVQIIPTDSPLVPSDLQLVSSNCSTGPLIVQLVPSVQLVPTDSPLHWSPQISNWSPQIVQLVPS